MLDLQVMHEPQQFANRAKLNVAYLSKKRCGVFSNYGEYLQL